MSNAVLVIGVSGSGKSRSIKNLKPSETFIINVMDKNLPFKGFSKSYKRISSDGLEGNYYAADDSNMILRIIKVINEKRPDIKNLIIDDFQYTMCSEFMKRASEKSFDKFIDIGKNAWNIIKAVINVRDNLFCAILSHSDSDQNGNVKCKTIGKMIDEKIVIEGLFTIVLHALIVDGQYKFLTQSDGTHIAKSPEDMFDKFIENDLNIVKQKIDMYLNEDINQ